MVEERESLTAKLCAFARAWHSYHSREKIHDDYLAYDFLGKEEYENVYDQIKAGLIGEKELIREEAYRAISEYLEPIPLSRAQFNEEHLMDFAGENGRIQYVICGAGGDTFAFRNDNDDIEIFEVDHPDTQRYKLDRIRELEWTIPANVHYVSVDFERESLKEKLLAAGFDREKKTFFSIMGVTYYLTLDSFANTLEEMAGLSGKGSEVVFDYPMKSGNFPGRVGELEEMTASLGEVMQGGYDHGEVCKVLGRLGYRVDTDLAPGQVQKRYFEGREDRLRAFENVSLMAAKLR